MTEPADSVGKDANEPTDHKWLAREIYDWFLEPEHYSVVHFAAEHNMSKEMLFRMCSEDKDCQEMLDYALTVQEYKLSHGAMVGEMDRNVALKFLETYAGWKGDVNILQRNEYRQYMNEAERVADSILGNGSAHTTEFISNRVVGMVGEADTDDEYEDTDE